MFFFFLTGLAFMSMWLYVSRPVPNVHRKLVPSSYSKSSLLKNSTYNRNKMILTTRQKICILKKLK